MQPAELKKLKEEFVSNLHGTTKWEVFCVVSCLPLCLLIAAYAEAWAQARARASSKPYQRWLVALPKFAYEFGIAVLPQVLLVMSVAPAEPAFLLLFLLWGSLALKLWMKLAHSPASKQHMLQMLQHISIPRKRFVSVFRGGLMLTTCLAILGVDFTTFPRRYAKAEGYGTGLMDVGVGAIVWAGGLVSAAAAAAAAAAAGPAVAATDAGKHLPASAAAAVSGVACGSAALTVRLWIGRLGKGVRAAVPLVLLGAGRLISTAAVGYQQHLGEYGLHWNFFWTIAAVSLLTLALPVPPAWLGPLGLGVSAAHQALLNLDLGLTPQGAIGSWMQADMSAEQRSALGFWTSNKEGLGSLPGYWALHLLGAAVGRHLAVGSLAASQRARACLTAGGGAGHGSSRSAAAVAECARCVWSWVGLLLLLDCAVWAAMLAAESWVEPISRRSCNLAYVLWVSAQCLAWLLLCLIADLLTSGLAGAGSSSPGMLLSSRIARTTDTAAATTAAGGGGGGLLPGVGSGGIAAGSSVSAPSGTAAAAAGLRNRPVGRRRSASSPTAALAGAAAAAAAAAAANSDAGGAAAAAAAAAAAVRQYDSPDGSPRPGRRAGGGPSSAAASSQQQQQGLQGSPSSSSSSGSSGQDGTSNAKQQQLTQQPSTLQGHAIAGHAAGTSSGNIGSSSSSSSAGPMRLMLAFNRNMLALFLLANLVTGAINLSINTLDVGRWPARVIVGLYMLLLCGVAVQLDTAGITLKAW